MDEADLQLARIYLSAFGDNVAEWSFESHTAGLRAVFQAGAAAQRKATLVAAVPGGESNG